MTVPAATRSLTRQVVAAAVVLAVVVAATFAMLIGAIRSLDRANRHADAVLGGVEAISILERMVVDAQTGARGFVITGRREFLKPTVAARRAIPAQQRRVRSLLRGADERRRFASLSAAIDAYLSTTINRGIRTAERSLAEARRLVATGEGDRRVEAMRRQFGAIRAGLHQDADRRHADVDDRVRRAVIVAVGAVALSMLLFAAYATYVTRFMVGPVRRVAETARRLAGGDRSARVPGADTAAGEIGAMARSFNSMAQALAAGRAELEEQSVKVSDYADELEVQRGELENTVIALETEKMRIEMISAFGEAVTQETRFAPLAHLILNGAADAARCDAGALYVRDARRGGELALATTRGIDPAALPDIVLPGDGLAGRAAVESRPITGERIAGAPMVGTVGGRAPIVHEVHVPLLQSGEVFGVLSLGRLSDVPFDHGDIVLIAHLSDQSAVALSKAVVLRELRRRETITRTVLDATPNPIALLDDGNVPVVANEPMREFLPLLREWPVPNVGDDVVRDEIQDPVGGHVFARYVARLDDDDVGLHGRVGVLRNVTTEREAERMKDEFFALVSHELRTPLTSIIGYLELLQDDLHAADGQDPAVAQRAQFLSVVDRNARRLLRLVGDLLFVAQVEAGKLTLEEGDVDLEAVARESVEAARPRAASAGVELVLEVEPVATCRGDRDRLAQALDNLVSNAIKFTPTAVASPCACSARGRKRSSRSRTRASAARRARAAPRRLRRHRRGRRRGRAGGGRRAHAGTGRARRLDAAPRRPGHRAGAARASGDAVDPDHAADRARDRHRPRARPRGRRHRAARQAVLAGRPGRAGERAPEHVGCHP
jgi:signal transduction histidine kinase/CHASE3 domain sensor protein